MMLLAILLQLIPAAEMAEGQPAPFAGVLLSPAAYSTIRADRDACVIERDAARKAVVDLRGLPDLLSESHRAMKAEILAELSDFARLAVVELAKAPLPPAPEFTPWYESPWLWGPVGAIVGGSTVWGLTR